jgi:hypothetical protein
MGAKHVAYWTVSLLLLLVISTNNSHSINLDGDSIQILDISDGNRGSSEHVTSVAGITDKQTEINASELTFVQKQLFSTGNETLPSADKLATVISDTSLQESSEGKEVANTNTTSPPLSSADVIMETEGKSEFLQQTSNANFSSFREFGHHSNLTNNDTEDDSASFLNSNQSYTFAPDYVTPQQYRADVHVESDNDNNYNNTAGQPFDENSFKQLINDGSEVHQDQIADQNDSYLKQNKYVHLENYSASEVQSPASNVSLDDVPLNQEQLDSPAAEFLDNSFDTEEIFEKIFNISLDDSVDNEPKHNFSYQADSEQHAKESPGTNIQDSGSHTKQNLSDNENNTLSNLFEVYHYSREPYPDGAMQNKTLAQHIEELVLSRFPSSDNNTDNDEVESGDHEENNISLGVEISPDDIGESDNEGTHSGASLAFVFDSTGSMWDDLVQVKMGAERIMATMLELPDRPIYNYVLVPFHDPSK